MPSLETLRGDIDVCPFRAISSRYRVRQENPEEEIEAIFAAVGMPLEELAAICINDDQNAFFKAMDEGKAKFVLEALPPNRERWNQCLLFDDLMDKLVKCICAPPAYIIELYNG